MPNWDIAIIDGFGVVDFPLVVNHVDVLDSYSSIDTIITNAIFDRTINDNTLITDIPLNLGNFYRTLLDSPMVWDTPQIGWGKEIADAIIITDSATKILGLISSEWVGFADSIHTNWYGVDKIEDSASFYDLPEAARIFLDILTDTFSTADVASKALVIQIIDYLLHDDIALSNLTANKTIADILSLIDSNECGFGHDITDSLSMSDTTLTLWILAVIAQDILNIADANSSIPEFNNLLSEGVNLVDSETIQGSYMSIIHDEVNFIVSIMLGGEVYQCWVLNTDELYPSIYSNYDFNSYAILNDNVYGAKSDGIYLLEGSTDAGIAIQTGVRMNLYNMGTHLGKRIIAAYFGMSGNKPVLKVTNENGAVDYYFINGKIPALAKGHEGKDWIFDLAKIDELDFVEITPAILSR